MIKRRAGSNQQRRINPLIQDHIRLQSVEKGEPSQDIQSELLANYVLAVSSGDLDAQAKYQAIFVKQGIRLTTANHLVAKKTGGGECLQPQS